MTQLIAKTRFTLPDAHRNMTAMCEHFREHDVDVVTTAQGYEIAYTNAKTVIEINGDSVVMAAYAPEVELLHQIKLSLTSHVLEYAGEHDIEIVWTGDKTQGKRQMQFRVIRVAAVTDLHVHMRRITFVGEGLASFDTASHLHCKLYFPQPGVAVAEWPVQGDDGVPRFPTGDKRLTSRTYTVRAIDTARNEITVDIVLHGDAGPGSAWASQATVGQEVGITGPGGQSIAAADWYLLAGDETALPAISRILEQLPEDATGVAMIEVDHVHDALPLVHPSGVNLIWLYRAGAAPGTTSLLVDAVRAVAWPTDPQTSVFAWSGAEFATFKCLRAYLREERQLTKEQHLVVSYWRRGQSEAA